jgi:hypothetical protein
MRRYNHWLYRVVAHAILRDDNEAGDVNARRRTPFSTWLTRVAVHGGLARVRKRNRVQQFNEAIPLNATPTSHGNNRALLARNAADDSTALVAMGEFISKGALKKWSNYAQQIEEGESSAPSITAFLQPNKYAARYQIRNV